MPTRLTLHRFAEFGALSASEEKKILSMGEPEERFPKGAIIRSEGEAPRFLYLLLEGWVAASVTLPSGDRQITKFHLPGDLLGSPSLCLSAAAETLVTLSQAIVSRVPVETFSRLFSQSPRFAARMFLSVQAERVALMDRLVSIGRTTAAARIAFLLTDLHDRLAQIGLIDQDHFQLCATQEQIGDHLGLTAVHVNRVFRELESDGLILRQRQRIRILDHEKLRRVAVKQPRVLNLDCELMTATSAA